MSEHDILVLFLSFQDSGLHATDGYSGSCRLKTEVTGIYIGVLKCTHSLTIVKIYMKLH